MAGNGETTSPRPYNVVAAFPDEHKAASAVDRLTAAGIPPSAIERHTPDDPTPDATAVLLSEMQDEAGEGWIGPGGLTMTPSQAKGAFLGTILAVAIGAGVGLAVGLVRGSIILMVALGVLGGATVGFLTGGISGSRAEGADERPGPTDDRRLSSERDHLVAVHADQRDVAERAAAVLQNLGAERVDLVDGAQRPLPRQARHPRPADPPGFWWRRAGHG